MIPSRLLAFLFVGLLVLTIAGPALAQEEECTEEDCASCRTTNFYYVLACAIIIFAVFFIWTNRHKVPKAPKEPKEPEAPKQE